MYVVGHSLGAAVAMITAAMLQGNAVPNAVKGVLTYGGPRVGDSSWATAYNSLGLGQSTLRYVNAHDAPLTFNCLPALGALKHKEHHA